MVYYSGVMFQSLETFCNLFILLGSAATSTRCEEKEARNLGEAHWNTEGKILALKTVTNSVIKSQFSVKYFRLCKN